MDNPNLDPKINPKMNSNLDSKMNSNLDPKMNSNLDPKMNSNLDPKISPHLDPKSDFISDLKPEPKSEPKSDPKSDHKPGPKYHHLVLSGGGIKGVAHVGAIKKLVDDGLIDLKQLKTVVGTSAGALLGSLVVLGFTIDEIWSFVYCLNFKKMFNPEIFLLFKKYGMETGQTIYNLFEEILHRKTGIKHITFKQLFDLNQIHFVIVGTNLTDKKEMYYDYINTPSFRISIAIRISISLPGMFVPVIIGGKTYIDGGMLNNYAMNLLEDKMDQTIGILICSEYHTEYKHPEEYFIAIMNLFMYSCVKDNEQKYPKNTLYIKKMPDPTLSFKFDIDSKTKMEFYKWGVESAEEFIKRQLEGLTSAP